MTVLISVLLFSNYNYFFTEKYRKVDIKAFENEFSSHITNEDLNIANIPEPVKYYFRNEKEIISVNDFIQKKSTRAVLSGYDRIYLVKNRGFTNSQLLVEAEAFLSSHIHPSTVRFPNLKVTVYQTTEK
jgi:hypothetical protein